MTKALFTLFVVAAIGVAAVWGLVYFVGLQASLIWTGVIGAIAWAVQTAVQQRQEYRRLLADQKRQQYFEFLDFLNEIIGLSGETDAPVDITNDAERLRQLRRWSLRLTMIGSDDVVRAWNEARISGVLSESAEGEQAGIARTVEILRDWGVLWLAMRKDCGQFDTKLTVTDILGSFVNDVAQYRSELEARPRR